MRIVDRFFYRCDELFLALGAGDAVDDMLRLKRNFFYLNNLFLKFNFGSCGDAVDDMLRLKVFFFSKFIFLNLRIPT